MNKWIKIIGILALIGLVTAGLVWKFYVNKPHADIENTLPVVTLSATELWKQFNDDLKLSDSLYTGKVIAITGKLSKVELNDSRVYLIFVMEPDPDFGNKTIRCELMPKYTGEGSAVKVNTILKIKGFCSGYDQTDIKFSNCSIIK